MFNNKNCAMSKTRPHNKFHIYSIPIVATLLLASCGSYQQASYYGDGIYSSGNEVVRVEKRNAEGVGAQQEEYNRYGDYFGQRAEQIGEVLDSEVFTDIDGYSSQMGNDTIPYGEQTDYLAYNNNYNGYPGWGDNPSSVSINVYGNNWGWGGLYGYGGLYGWGNPYWGYGWNYPYYGWGWGWYNPWRYNRWGWGGYYGSWGYPYHGWGYAGYYGHWNRPYYYSDYGRSYARITGRRGYDNNYIGGSTLLGRSNRVASRGNGTYRVRTNANGGTLASRSRGTYGEGSTARRAISADAADRNMDYRSSRSTRYSPQSGTSRTSRSYGTTPTKRSDNGYYNSGARTRQSSPAYRSSRSSRTYQSQGTTVPRSSGYSRPSSSSRSSGTIQRSGGSSRSSGAASRSSGSSRSGRGGN